MSERNPAPTPFLSTARITFDESDPAGILFYGNVFPLAHRAFEEMIESSGIPWPDWFSSDRWAVPITRASAEFSAPLSAGRTARIEVMVTEMRESACAVETIFILDGATCARVETVHVFVDRGTGEKMPIPAALREKLEPFTRPG
jgi:acyl-CoA thioesterase FadM